MKKTKAALALALPVVAGVLVFGAGTAQAAEAEYYPAVGWALEDTDATIYNCNLNPPTDRTPAAASKIVNKYTVDLVGKGTPAPPHYGTSIETANLNLPVASGDKVTVHYSLSDANPAGGAIRLFVYDKPNGDTDCEGPKQVVAVTSDSSANGTLEIEVSFTGKIGTLGLVYDSSNSDANGKVRFSNLKVKNTTVLFLKPATTTPPTTGTVTTPATTTPAVGGGGAAGPGELVVTGVDGRTIGIAGAGAVVAGLMLLLWTRRNREASEEAAE